jgi:large subunit ribosomal protein L15
MRFPKRGFHNYTRVEYACVNLDAIESRFPAQAEVTLQRLREMDLVKGSKAQLKILGRGELSKPLTVRAHRFTHSARRKIEQAGGKVEVV